MNLFNHNNVEKTYEENGYIIGVNSHKIYHVPDTDSYVLPDGTTGLSETAIAEMRCSKPRQITVPGSFKKFNVQLLNFENLSSILLGEGIEEVKCLFGSRQSAVDIKLPKTIKKIGQNNYPVVQDLELPYGTVEIETMFASHDTNLVSVNIPGTIKVIPKGAFNQCRNLQRVILKEGVETSLTDAFRGTNNLHMLVLPSTYNGTIELSMENRPCSNVRGNSVYDGKKWNEELNNILSVLVTRGNKTFEFDFKRGEQPTIEIRQNIINIRCLGQHSVISIDCEKFEQGVYHIENGRINLQKSNTFTTSSQPRPEKGNGTPRIYNDSQEQEVLDKLDLLFQNAYRDNITNRNDFKGLPNTTKMQIKKAMRASFFQIAKQFGTTNTDYETFDFLFNKVLKEMKFDEAISDSQIPNDFNASRKTK